MNQQSPRLAFTRGISTPPSALRGRWLLFFRAAWVVLAVIVIGLDLAGIPYAYEQSASALTAENARELRELGISREFYAAYNGAGLSTFVTLVFFAVAAVIFWRRSQDPMALFGSFTLLVFGGAAVIGTMHELADARPAFWFPVNLLDYVGQVAFSVFFYLFPDGRFVPRWTRWLALAMALLFVPATFFPDSTFNLFAGPFFIVFIGSLLFAQVYRYRRVSNPMQRQQTKWVVFGSVVALAGFSVAFAIGLLILGDQGSRPQAEMILRTLIFGFILLIPLSIGVAVLRHRLYDIDLVINRTLVYGALTACVVGIYVFVVGYLGALFRVENNLLVSLAATGVVAVIFAPMRHRLQRAVNRLMYGERDDPYAVLSRLGQRLEVALAPDVALVTIVETTAQALRLPHAAITVEQDGKPMTAAEYGSPSGEPVVLPLVYQTEPVGRLILAPRAPGEPFSASDRRLLDDLARQAGVAVHAARLTADLRRSREQLVSAREEERRRLRRDLHDGLGPRLAAQTLKVGSARSLYPRDPDAADALLAGIEADVEAALSDVRRLVYDLRPPALDELGLAGAIRQSATQYAANGLRVTVNAPESGSLPPLPAAVEVAAYRIAQEALTNVSRHAGAHNCTVRLSIDDVLELEISDDGVGLSPGCPAGVGLNSMRERAEELGGTCVVQKASARGTRVLASLPLPEVGGPPEDA